MSENTIRLVNPRGRVVVVNERDVSMLLKRGFLYPPDDQPNIIYSQVHDKGQEAIQVIRKEEPQVQVELHRLGDVLPAEKL